MTFSKTYLFGTTFLRIDVGQAFEMYPLSEIESVFGQSDQVGGPHVALILKNGAKRDFNNEEALAARKFFDGLQRVSQ